MEERACFGGTNKCNVTLKLQWLPEHDGNIAEGELLVLSSPEIVINLKVCLRNCNYNWELQSAR